MTRYLITLSFLALTISCPPKGSDTAESREKCVPVTEVCNSIDDDCDGEIDEGVTTTYYRDADGDGYGAESLSTEACDAPEGYVVDNTDCNDSDASVNPGAIEIWHDWFDQNCDDVGMECTDWDSDLYYGGGRECREPMDCDDEDRTVHPNAPEACNDIDDDCDGEVDEEATNPSTWYLDADGDGYGDPTSTPVEACDAPEGYVDNNTDCDDAVAAINPGEEETPGNKTDENCDSLTE